MSSAFIWKPSARKINRLSDLQKTILAVIILFIIFGFGPSGIFLAVLWCILFVLAWPLIKPILMWMGLVAGVVFVGVAGICIGLFLLWAVASGILIAAL